MPKLINHTEKREAIIRQTYELFQSKHWQDLSMREVAAELHVSTGTLYYYFADKTSLQESIFSWMIDRDMTELAERVPQGMPFEERLGLISDYVLENRVFLSLMSLALPEFIRQRQTETPREVFAGVQALRTGLQRVLDTIEPRLITSILTFCLGLVTHDLFDQQGLHDGVYRDFFRSFVGR